MDLLRSEPPNSKDHHSFLRAGKCMYVLKGGRIIYKSRPFCLRLCGELISDAALVPAIGPNRKKYNGKFIIRLYRVIKQCRTVSRCNGFDTRLSV